MEFVEEEPVRFTDHEGVVWERTGFCNRCGECCKGNPFTGDSCGYCPLFAWMEKSVGRCTDRKHPYYLNGCNTFPSHPTQITDKPSCSYKFRRVN